MAEWLADDSAGRLRGTKSGHALSSPSAYPTAVVIQNRTKESSVLIIRSS